jgi:hypothetical protein
MVKKLRDEDINLLFRLATTDANAEKLDEENLPGSGGSEIARLYRRTASVMQQYVLTCLTTRDMLQMDEIERTGTCLYAKKLGVDLAEIVVYTCEEFTIEMTDRLCGRNLKTSIFLKTPYCLIKENIVKKAAFQVNLSPEVTYGVIDEANPSVTLFQMQSNWDHREYLWKIDGAMTKTAEYREYGGDDHMTVWFDDFMRYSEESKKREIALLLATAIHAVNVAGTWMPARSDDGVEYSPYHQDRIPVDNVCRYLCALASRMHDESHNELTLDEIGKLLFQGPLEGFLPRGVRRAYFLDGRQHALGNPDYMLPLTWGGERVEVLGLNYTLRTPDRKYDKDKNHKTRVGDFIDLRESDARPLLQPGSQHDNTNVTPPIVLLPTPLNFEILQESNYIDLTREEYVLRGESNETRIPVDVTFTVTKDKVQVTMTPGHVKPQQNTLVMLQLDSTMETKVKKLNKDCHAHGRKYCQECLGCGTTATIFGLLSEEECKGNDEEYNLCLYCNIITMMIYVQWAAWRLTTLFVNWEEDMPGVRKVIEFLKNIPRPYREVVPKRDEVLKDVSVLSAMTKNHRQEVRRLVVPMGMEVLVPMDDSDDDN